MRGTRQAAPGRVRSERVPREGLHEGGMQREARVTHAPAFCMRRIRDAIGDTIALGISRFAAACAPVHAAAVIGVPAAAAL